MTNEVILADIHFIYLLGVICILGVMVLRKDTVLPCILFIFLIGFIGDLSIVSGIQSLFKAILYAAINFMDIIVTIALVTALSKCLADLGSDRILMSPGAKLIKTPSIAYWVVGITMMVMSYFLWPSPSVALIGAIMLPVAVKADLPPICVAMAMNIFGHGISLSTDFVIQGAPTITAQAAGIEPHSIINEGMPLFITMGVVTTMAAYFVSKKEIKKYAAYKESIEGESIEEDSVKTRVSIIMAVITPIAFLADIIMMCIFDIKGVDATAIVGGTAILLLSLGSVLKYGANSLGKITDYIRHGFIFGIKIFAPVIVIGGFFFLGGDNIGEILGKTFENHTGIMTDWAMWISDKVALNKYPVAFIQSFAGILTGMDGSGFSGLPLVGSLATTLGTAVDLNIAVLAALGQITTIWVGGGVLVPWALIPVAAICNVEPLELARKNFLPVVIGFIATFIVACFLL